MPQIVDLKHKVLNNYRNTDMLPKINSLIAANNAEESLSFMYRF